jgi:hypothetical protein
MTFTGLVNDVHRTGKSGMIKVKTLNYNVKCVQGVMESSRSVPVVTVSIKYERGGQSHTSESLLH